MHESFMKEAWSGRIDREEVPELSLRLHQCVQPFAPSGQSSSDGVVVIGFCSDEGVKRNQGRIGAAQAPNQLRRYLSQLPWQANLPVYDAGNIDCQDGQLEAAHLALAEQVALVLAHRGFPFILGGGHEVAYGSWLGLVTHLERTIADHSVRPTIGIINFDAHFDLRKAEQSSSGTPFYQIAEGCKARNIDFHYACFGVSETANTLALFERADALNVCVRKDKALTLLDLPSASAQLASFMEACDLIYLTIDLDVFPTAVAPGVSAPAPRGVSVEVIESLIDGIKATGKLAVADIAEYNPTYDIDNHTARVAARLFYTITRG